MKKLRKTTHNRENSRSLTSREPLQIATPRKKIEAHQKRSGPHDDRRQIENVGQRHRVKIKQRCQINETDEQDDGVHWFHRFSELRPAVRRFLLIDRALTMLLQLFFPHFSSLCPLWSLHQALLPAFTHDTFLPPPQEALLSTQPGKKTTWLRSFTSKEQRHASL